MISSFNKLNYLSNIGKGGIIYTGSILKDLTPKNQTIPISSIIS